MKERWFQFGRIVSVALIMGCSSGPFATRPPGDRVAQCRGRLTLEQGVRSQFSLDLMRHDDDFTLYATIPGERIRYSRVHDISFENDRLVLELGSGREIGGTVSGSLEFSGAWEDFNGSFTVDLE